MNFTKLLGLAAGHVEARIIQSAVELGIFDALEKSPLNAESVANHLGLESKATDLLLNALASLGLLQKRGESFSLAEVAQKHLARHSPQHLGGMIRFESSLWGCWEKLPQAIRTGKPVRPPNMYQDDPAETAIFINAMDSLVKARGDAQVLASALDWSTVCELLDVGSGPATYPIALCKAFPALRATVIDLPATLKITGQFLKEAGLEDRIRLIAGDYRSDPIPGSYDAILLSNIVHGENEARNEALIRKLTNTLKPAGRMIIKDHILDDSRSHPPVGAIFSLLMLLTTAGGRCYTFHEIKSWMTAAGLSNIREIDLPPPLTSSLVIGESG